MGAILGIHWRSRFCSSGSILSWLALKCSPTGISSTLTSCFKIHKVCEYAAITVVQVRCALLRHVVWSGLSPLSTVYVPCAVLIDLFVLTGRFRVLAASPAWDVVLVQRATRCWRVQCQLWIISSISPPHFFPLIYAHTHTHTHVLCKLSHFNEGISHNQCTWSVN